MSDDIRDAIDRHELAQDEYVQKAIAELRKLANRRDSESTHLEADGVLLTLLSDLGYTEVVEAWEAIQPKWYG